MPFTNLAKKVQTTFPLHRWRDHKMLLGVSGGADSVALLRIFHHLAKGLPSSNIIVCHANHQLRGKESDDDQEFVMQLCDQLNVPLEVKTLPIKHPDSDGIESNLRNLRYQMFKEFAAKHAARYVLTAHNANDQLETILFRILRGTGIGGLAGIPTIRPLCDNVSMIRPLLEISRQEIVELLNSIGQTFRVDSSNQSDDYSRNKIRNKLIPLIENEFGWKLLDRIQPLAIQASEQQQLLDDICEPLVESAVQFSSGSFSIQRSEVGDHPAIVIRHLLVSAWKKMHWPLQAMTFEKWSQLATRVVDREKKGQPSIQMLPGKIKVSVDENSITFCQE